MKLRRLVLGAVSLVGLLLLLAAGGLWQALRPDAPTEAVRARAAERVRRTTEVAPSRTVRAPVAGGCAAWVVVTDPDSLPLEGVDVGVVLGAEERGAPRAAGQASTLGQTDETGRARLEGLPCGQTVLWAGWGEGSPLHGEAQATLQAGREPTVALSVTPAALVRVRVVDVQGSPVPMAMIAQQGGMLGPGGEAVFAQEEPGVFHVPVPVGGPVEVSVHAAEMGPLGSESYDEDLVLDVTLEDLAGADEHGVVDEVEVELAIDRVVQVHCLGQPDEACTGVEPIQCTAPLVPVGTACRSQQGVTACICPPGAAAVRGGGATVRVEPGESEAWLDLSFGGGVTGRALVDGKPVRCVVSVVRMPTGLEDLPRGGILGRSSSCDEDGRFRVEGVPPGDWYVEVQGADYEGLGSTPAAQAEPARVQDQMVDVGDVDLFGGGSIEGTARDGLTGAPLRYGPVMALRAPRSGGRSTPAFSDADETGHFSFSGLLPGTWEVFVLSSPFRRVTVEVEEGLLTDGVEVTTAEATVLEDNGFALGGSTGGALSVTEVDPEGPAAAAGLQAGDEVVGVTVFGVDSTVLPDALSGRLASGLLGHWSGPGVGLVIDRDGVLMDVELE